MLPSMSNELPPSKVTASPGPASMSWPALATGGALTNTSSSSLVDEQVDPAAGLSLTGFEQESAPRHLGSASLRIMPTDRVAAAADVTTLGAYWMDAGNTTKYGGHTLVNLRGHVEVTEGVGQTGIVGILRNGDGPTVLVRADMDGT